MKRIWSKALLAFASLLLLGGVHVGQAANFTNQLDEIKNLDKGTPLYLYESNELITKKSSIDMAWHTSHMSHYSHGSHQSHYSHYSHYSGY